MQKGNISVQTENIFPIIKKFLYSDHEIFLRELIANAVDATSKLRTLARRGEVKEEIGDARIEVIADAEANTLTIRDAGIGMTGEEVMKYLNQVAFSSAAEFLEKYKDDASIIGHFGLGFYSAFMVAAKVEVNTKSYKEGSQAVRWTCDGNPEYTLEDIEKETRGTDIVLHLNEEDIEFAEQGRIQGLLDKYCKFLPVEIQFGTKTEELEVETENATEENADTENAEEAEPVKQTIEVPNIINNPKPAWTKQPSELSEEDYKAFYQELYPFSSEPLFWVHLNIDYPFNLTGILYFPNISNQMEMQRNKIQLYCNQVYVTDEVKDIVPEFLTLLHGVIDSPDIPLNVSRSYLQSDRNVKKITEYITRKVADKLHELFRKERETYNDKWSSIDAFVKYGFVTEEKFAEKAMKFALLENAQGELFSIEDYKEKIKDNQTDKDGNLIFLYTNNVDQHDAYIKKAEAAGYDVLKFDKAVIDPHFIQNLERKIEKATFTRIDANPVDKLIAKDETRESVLNEADQEKVKEVFTTCINDSAVSVNMEALSPEDFPVMITRPEFMRRMREMSMGQGMDMGNMPEYYNLVVNTNHPTVAKVLEDGGDSKAKHLFDLARLHQGMLTGSELTDFVQKSLDML
ncbi:MAG: molecular chaperone HtpG [Saprospiraceae bacterium]|nr:molecular chaperone HtpG [Saprospiraceae bacterium]